VVTRRGATKLGCLFQLLVLAAIGYFGNGAAQVYLRYLTFKDVVTNEVKFNAAKRSIPEWRNRIQFLADSLEMPEEAGIAVVRRTAKQTFIEVHYDEEIVLPGFKKDVHFEVKAQGNL
jgi:O-succinylbenzoate synthase